MTSSLTESNLQSALAESQRGITELKHIVVKKLSDDKSDNPRLGFCDFLKVEVVQLTSDLYDEFQQEIFNLVMRLKREKGKGKAAANLPTHNQHEYGPDRHVQPSLDLTTVSSVSHPDAGPTAADATDIYTCTTSTSTGAAFTTFTEAHSTDIYLGT